MPSWAPGPRTQIAARLYLAEPTVKTHVGRILAKLGLRDRVHIVIRAHGNGLVRRRDHRPLPADPRDLPTGGPGEILGRAATRTGRLVIGPDQVTGPTVRWAHAHFAAPKSPSDTTMSPLGPRPKGRCWPEEMSD